MLNYLLVEKYYQNKTLIIQRCFYTSIAFARYIILTIANCNNKELRIISYFSSMKVEDFYNMDIFNVIRIFI